MGITLSFAVSADKHFLARQLPNEAILLLLVLHHLGIHVGYSSPERRDFRMTLRKDPLLPCDYDFFIHGFYWDK